MNTVDVFEKELLKVKWICKELEKSVDSFLENNPKETLAEGLQNCILEDHIVFSRLEELSEEKSKLDVLIRLAYELNDAKSKSNEIGLIFNDLLSEDAIIQDKTLHLNWHPYNKIESVDIKGGLREYGSS